MSRRVDVEGDRKETCSWDRKGSSDFVPGFLFDNNKAQKGCDVFQNYFNLQQLAAGTDSHLSETSCLTDAQGPAGRRDFCSVGETLNM